MHINILFLLFTSSFLISAESISNQDDKVRYKQNFIEQLDSDDPEVQSMIEQLKEDYESDRKQINNKYAQKKKQLRKKKQQEMQLLSQSFKGKVQRMERRYPEKIKQKMKTKPLNKSVMNYLDPRENDSNLKENKKKIQRENRRKKLGKVSSATDVSTNKEELKPNKILSK